MLLQGGILEGRNATNATGAAGGNQSELRTNLEQARMALQNNDTQGAMMYLDMALSALGGGAAGGTQGNTTSNTTIASSNAITTGSQNGIPPVGGTGAADVDDEITEEEEEMIAQLTAIIIMMMLMTEVATRKQTVLRQIQKRKIIANVVG